MEFKKNVVEGSFKSCVFNNEEKDLNFFEVFFNYFMIIFSYFNIYRMVLRSQKRKKVRLCKLIKHNKSFFILNKNRRIPLLLLIKKTKKKKRMTFFWIFEFRFVFFLILIQIPHQIIFNYSKKNIFLLNI